MLQGTWSAYYTHLEIDPDLVPHNKACCLVSVLQNHGCKHPSWIFLLSVLFQMAFCSSVPSKDNKEGLIVKN